MMMTEMPVKSSVCVWPVSFSLFQGQARRAGKEGHEQMNQTRDRAGARISRKAGAGTAGTRSEGP